MSLRLLLSCGEPSGDLYAGALCRELRTLSPGLTMAGLGGPSFAAAGGELLADYRGLSATGFTEWIGKVPKYAALRRRFVELARAGNVDGLVLIDYGGFNVRLGQSMRRLGLPIVYYVSPQIWAWRARTARAVARLALSPARQQRDDGRVASIGAVADKVLVIFPFEESIYREAGVPVEFVGHPLIDLARPARTRAEFLRAQGFDPTGSTVAILPGSRPSEVRRILPTLIEAAQLMRAQLPALQWVIARAPSLDDSLFAPARALDRAAIVTGDTDTVLASSDVALTASGTATVQTALHDTPMVVVYRVSPLEYGFGRRLVRLNTFAMVNLIAGRTIVPELIQENFTPAAVAREALSMLTDPARTARIREGLAEVRRKLGEPGASRRAAEAILQVVGKR